MYNFSIQKYGIDEYQQYTPICASEVKVREIFIQRQSTLVIYSSSRGHCIVSEGSLKDLDQVGSEDVNPKVRLKDLSILPLRQLKVATY